MLLFGLMSLRLLVRFALVSLCCFAGCAKRETVVEAGRRLQILHIGNGAEPRDLDPHIAVAYNDYNVLIALFEGLTVLDEATSLLDTASARRAEGALDRVLAGRTVIAIAHRLHTAAAADRVAVMADGEIVELGSPGVLLAAGGPYAQLVAAAA